MNTTTNTEKKTQVQMLSEIRDYIEKTEGPDEMLEFLDGRIELLKAQAEASKARKAAKKKTDDPLAAAVAAQITGELKTVNDIVEAISKDFPDATNSKVVARLTALCKQGIIGKVQIAVGQGKRAMAYALAEYMPKD